MSQYQDLQVPQQSDKVIISCFKKLAAHVRSTAFDLNVIGDPGLGELAIDSDELKKLSKANLCVIESAIINISGFSVSYQRGGFANSYPSGTQKQKSPFYDEFRFGPYNNNTKLESNIRVELASIVSKEMIKLSPGRGVGQSEEQLQLEAIHSATLSRLEHLNEELINTTQNYRIQLDGQYSDKSDSLSNEFLRKEQTLDDACQAKIDSLNKEKEALESLKKEIDDRSNTHARRDIRKDILKEIKNRQSEFNLTDGTVEKRKPVAYAMYLLVAIFTIAAVVSGVEFYRVIGSEDSTKLAIAGAKQAFYSFGVIASIIFYIKWSNRWFEQHSSSEFQLKQLELDMERASWLVETSLEWKDAKGTAIPTELLDSLSSNLFSGSSKPEDILHPADQLASALLGSASSVKLKSGDSEIVIDPKKLAKSETK
jgi:hypothetical protein